MADVALAVLQTGISLAGLLLIFSGLLFSKAASFNSTARATKFVLLARATLIPILMALALSWISVEALAGSQWAAANLIIALRVTLGVTALFAMVGVISAA